jgi:hypothetical protein
MNLMMHSQGVHAGANGSKRNLQKKTAAQGSGNNLRFRRQLIASKTGINKQATDKAS